MVMDSVVEVGKGQKWMGYSTPQFNEGHQGNLCFADCIYLGWDADKRWQRPPKGHQGGRRGPVVWIKGGNVGRGDSCLRWEAAPVSGDGSQTIQSVAPQCITRCTPGCIAHYLARALNSPYIPLSPWPWPWVVMWTRLKPNSDDILHINNPDPKAKMWGPGVPKIKNCLRISRASLKSRDVCVFLWVP